jgi:hypothetical protein
MHLPCKLYSLKFAICYDGVENSVIFVNAFVECQFANLKIDN